MTENAADAGLEILSALLARFLPLRVTDIGANPIGAPVSYQSLLDAGLAHLTAFEPQDGPRDALTGGSDPTQNILSDAVGNGGPALLHLCRNDGFSSLFRPDRRSADLFGTHRSTDVTGTRSVRTVRLDDVAGPDSTDFLKIDIQGGELDAIAHGRAALGSAMVIQTEIRFFPLYEDEPSPGALWNELTDQGFQFHSLAEVKRTTPASRFKKPMRKRFYSQYVDGDALFVRDLRTRSDWSDRQLAVLALLAGTAMAAPDLALFCLDALAGRRLLSDEDVESYCATLPSGMLRG